MTTPTADKLDALADAMQKDIDNARRPMTQNPTPKRQREYHGRLLDADNLERGQRALRALAIAHRAGTVPACLANIKTKTVVLPLVRHRHESHSYYDIHDTGQYADVSEAGHALQAMIDAKSPEQAKADAEREHAQTIDRMVDDLRFQDIPGFFPTPDPVIHAMLAEANILPGQFVLEPSAGIGSIADAIRESVPTIKPLCCEIRPRLRDILKAKGHRLTDASDFLELPTAGQFDRIVMNPPFENLQDVDHVRHAYGCLRPGGRLVALMSPSGFCNGRRKGEEFREWLDAIPHRMSSLPEGSFRGVATFRQTGVAVCLVVIEKPTTR